MGSWLQDAGDLREEVLQQMDKMAATLDALAGLGERVDRAEAELGQQQVSRLHFVQHVALVLRRGSYL